MAWHLLACAEEKQAHRQSPQAHRRIKEGQSNACSQVRGRLSSLDTQGNTVQPRGDLGTDTSYRRVNPDTDVAGKAPAEKGHNSNKMMCLEQTESMWQKAGEGWPRAERAR